MQYGPVEAISNSIGSLKAIHTLIQTSGLSRALVAINLQSTTDINRVLTDELKELIASLERALDGGEESLKSATEKLMKFVNKWNSQAFTVTQLLENEKYLPVIEGTNNGVETIQMVAEALQGPLKLLMNSEFADDRVVAQQIADRNAKLARGGYKYSRNELVTTELAFFKTLTTVSEIAKKDELKIAERLQAAGCPATAELLKLCVPLQLYSKEVHGILNESLENPHLLSNPEVQKKLHVYFTVLTKASDLYKISQQKELGARFDKSPEGIKINKLFRDGGAGTLTLSAALAQPMQRIMRFEMLIKAIIENAPFDPELTEDLINQFLFFKQQAAKANIVPDQKLTRAKPRYLASSYASYKEKAVEDAFTYFNRNPDGSLFDTQTQEKCLFHKSLEGRGQESAAGFYKKADGSQFLIKEDPENVMEGTAYFITHTSLVPQVLHEAANFACVGVVNEGHSGPKAVSIQARVAGGKVVPWDEVVYGRKRNPKTLYSEESWYPDAIEKNINQLSSDAQWQLAAGICMSQAVGDESLHVGQYMAKLDENDNVMGIVRVDLGARGRYAVDRERKTDYNHASTSYLYAHSGQFGKDYIEFLLRSQTLHHKLNLLWASMVSQEDFPEQIYKASKVTFMKEFSKIPLYQQEIALNRILQTVNKGAEEHIKLPESDNISDQIEFLADKLAKMDANRALGMQISAIEDYENNLSKKIDFVCMNLKESDQLEKVKSLAQSCAKVQEDLVLNGSGSVKEKERVETLYAELNQQVLKMTSAESINFDQIYAVNLIMSDVLEAYKLILLKEGVEKNQMELEVVNQRLQACKTIELSTLYGKTTTSETKQAYATNFIKMACEINPDLPDLLMTDSSMIEKFKRHTGVGGWTHQKTRGQMFLESIYQNYGLPVSRIQYTVPQYDLLNAIKEGDFSRGLDLMKKLTVYDALVPDRLGKTALHYLMETADTEQGCELIIDILSKSLGSVKNTDLNILDGEGNSPLHCLHQNANVDAIRGEIDKASSLKLAVYGRYKTENLFNESQKNKADQTPLEMQPEVKKRASLDM